MARRRQRRQLAGEVPDAVLLDSEGLSAGAQGDARVRAELTVAEQLGRGCTSVASRWPRSFAASDETLACIRCYQSSRRSRSPMNSAALPESC